MSDTDSIKTDKSHSDLQQKYDKLAMEFAKVRMQLNVLKKAYTAKMSKLDDKSLESLDQFEGMQYDIISTNNLGSHEDFNKQKQINPKVKGAEDLKSKDVQLLKQDIKTMNHYIHRVLESTKSNQIDYNTVMSEIEYCKSVQNSCSTNFSELLNNELVNLKCSISACLYKILYNKLDSRTKINTDDSRLIYPKHYCLDSSYKTDEERFQKVFITLVLHFFLAFIVNLHDVLEYLLREIDPDSMHTLQSSLNELTDQFHCNSSAFEKILIYCNYLKTFKFDVQHILMENILLFVSNKYTEYVECIKNLIKLDNAHIHCSLLRQNIISFIALKFPIEELVESSECWDSSIINKKLSDVHDTVHSVLRVINIMEFELLYKSSQEDMHWHMKNPLLYVKQSKKAKNELNSPSISQKSYEIMFHECNDKLTKEMNKSMSLEKEKNHWELKYKLLCQKPEYQIANKNKQFSSSETFIVENQLGKCESSFHFDDEVIEREKELKSYFEKRINNLISTNNELSSKNNAYSLEITVLKTRLDHSISVRNEIELKLQEALEHIEDLKEEFHLTSTNYESQLRAMTEHLASLNETVVLERRHIDDLKSQLKVKGDKKKFSK